MKLNLKAGQTSNILQFFVSDSSSSTGAGLTGLTNASAGLTAYYHRDTDTTATQINLVTMTVGSFTSSGFKEIDATNMPGWYQFCPPDAAIAAGAKNCAFHLKGATNMAPLPLEVQLVAYDPYDSVRLGLTAMPNAAAGANGGLPLSVDASGRVDVLKINGTSQTARDIGASVLLSPGTGTGQLDITAGVTKANTTQISGTAQTARDIGASVLLSPGTGTGQLDFTSGVVKANLAQILGTALTETAGQIAAGFKQFFNIGSPTSTMNVITTVTTTTTATNLTTNNDKTGYGLSSAAVQAIWDALTSALTTVGSIGKLLVDNINATISSRLATAGYTAPDNADIVAIKAKTDNLPADPASTTQVNAVAANVWDVTLASHVAAGSTGNALNAAGAAGDPWATALPGAYGAGTAGKIIGDNVNATISSRLPTSSYTAPDNTDIVAIKAKTDNLPADPASNTQVNTRLATSGYTAPDNTSITAIKAKTDNLPADPASNTQVNTRLATAGYTAPDNTSITAIKAKTDNLPADPASNTQVNTRLATSGYTAPDNADIVAIKAKTDQLVFANSRVNANSKDVVQKNTALPNFEFLMTDSTNHNPTPGLTVTVQRSIDGGAFANTTNTPTEIGSGLYSINLSAADLNGSVIGFKFTAVGADTRFVTILTNS